MTIDFGFWTFFKLIQVGFVIACLTTKGVTDREATKIFYYFQKISREWSLLNNVTWDRLGAAVADATYGGYLIITFALFMGRLFGELPTKRKITEIILLGVGIVLFVVLGSLVFAALDSVPEDLVDNAAILGCFSLATALLFLIDLAGPRQRKTKQPQPHPLTATETKSSQTKTSSFDAPDSSFRTEKEIESKYFRDETLPKTNFNHGYSYTNGTNIVPGYHRINGTNVKEMEKDQEVDEVISQIVKQEPVWSRIRKGQYGRFDIMPHYYFPSPEPPDDGKVPTKPGDPGYVQHTAQKWGKDIQNRPPTDV